MDQRGGRRLAVGAGDADHLVRRQLGPGAGEQLDVADDLDPGLAGALRDRVAVERKAGGDDEAVELAEVGFVEVAAQSPGEGGVQAAAPAFAGRSRLSRASFASHAVTLAPLASSASTVASPDRARP